MKLYTEEQMAKVWMAGQKYWETSGASITFEELLEHEKPIELPSDEDILEECNKLPFEKHVDCGMYNDGQVDGFELGAKWMKEQILNQNEG